MVLKKNFLFYICKCNLTVSLLSWPLNKVEFLYKSVLCAKIFFLNWPSDSEEEDYFYIFFSIILLFHYYLPWRRTWPFIWSNVNPLHPRRRFLKIFNIIYRFDIISPWKRVLPFVWTNLYNLHTKNLVQIGNIYFQCILDVRYNLPLEKRMFLFFPPFTQGCFVSSLVVFEQYLLRSRRERLPKTRSYVYLLCT